MSAATSLQIPSQVNAPVVTRIVTCEGEFLDLRENWQQIISQSPQQNAIHEFEYLFGWWKAFGIRCPKSQRPGHLHVIVVSKGDAVIGILPFFYFDVSFLSLRRLRPMGYAGRLEPFDLTEEPLIAIVPGSEEIVLNESIAEIEKGLTDGTWDCAILRWFGNLQVSKRSEYWSRFKRKVGSAYVNLPRDWNTFRNGLSRSMRDNLPYYGRLLTRHGHEWHVEIITGSNWNRALQDLIHLHRLRATLSNDPNRLSHFTHPEHVAFIDELKSLPGNTRAFVGTLRVNDEVIAAQLYLDDGLTLICSYSGHDPAWSRYSPLFVLQVEMIKSAIARGVKRLDLLCGEADWQERWRPTRDFPINKLTLASKRLLPTLRCVLYVLKRESTIWWHKTRLHRWIRRQRIVQSIESLTQACYFGHARHIHMLVTLHRMHARY